jgi:hypothetical protein
VDAATEERIVEIIDRALADCSRENPGRTEVLDVLLDVRLRVLELAVFDWIESGDGSPGLEHRPRWPGFAGSKRRPG